MLENNMLHGCHVPSAVLVPTFTDLFKERSNALLIR